MDPLNAFDFNFRPGRNGTDNRTAWEEAIRGAQAQRRPLYVPAGTYALELTQSQNTGATLSQSVTIFGDGPDYTVIDVYPKVVSFPFSVIRWDEPDLHVTVKDLKVLGPTGTSATYPDQTPPCSFMEGLTRRPYGTDNQITIDNLLVTGKFVNVIHTANGDGLVDIRNSDLTALSTCVAVFETTNSFMNKRFHADNCRFASGVPATRTSDGQAFGICVYLHPHIATRVTNCRFYDNPRDAIKQFGVDAVGHAPKYSQFIGCHFYNCTAYTIITPGENVVTLIEGCTFDQGYIACRNKTNVIGCEFRTSAGIRTTVGREKEFEVNIVGCWVHRFDPGSAFSDSEGMSLLIRDCMFSFGKGANNDSLGVSLGQAAYGEVSRCRFVGRTPATPHAQTGVLISPAANTRHKVEHCSFAGNFQLGGITIQPGADSASVEVNSCDFSQVVAVPIHFNTSSIAFGNVIRGQDNIFNDQAMGTGGQATDLTARLRPRRATSVKKVAAAAVPSEPNRQQIVLDRSFNTFHVIGPRIDYVRMEVSKVERNKFEGPVHLIADNSLQFTKDGNIRPRTGNPRPMYEVVTLFYDPVKDLWYE